MSGNVRRERKLSARKRRAIRARLQGHSQQDAAQLAGVTARTLRRWTNEDEAFATELRRQSRLLVSEAAQRLEGSLDLAVGVMLEAAADQSAPNHVRLRAADSVTVKALKLREFSELEARIALLDQSLKEATQ